MRTNLSVSECHDDKRYDKLHDTGDSTEDLSVGIDRPEGGRKKKKGEN
jgi:hypothetical protein